MSFISKIHKSDLARLLRNQGTYVRPTNTIWPSESMCNLGPLSVGECKRSVYYKITGEKQTSPMSLFGKQICEAGSSCEKTQIETYKREGLYINEQVPIDFQVPGSVNNVKISGKVDVIIQDEGVKKAIEVKSVSTFKTGQRFGNDKNLPLPSPENLMQAMLYKYYFTYTDVGKAYDVKEVILHYVNRDNNSKIFYKVDIDTEGYPIITCFTSDGTEKYTLKLSEHPSIQELIDNPSQCENNPNAFRLAELRININDIFKKSDSVYDYVKDKTPPPTDYKIVYDKDDIEREHNLGRLSTLKYNKYKKGKESYGDTKCTYCSYMKKCMEDSGIRLKNLNIRVDIEEIE